MEMDSQGLRIREFKSISNVKDKKGRVLVFRSRYASCFIITLRGKIRFTFDDQTIITDRSQGIFIPEGAAYTNECLEDAQSISVNFFLERPAPSPRALNSMNEVLAMEFYRDISQKACEKKKHAQYYLLAKLYQLAYLLFPADSPKNEKERLCEKALLYMQSELARPDLQIDEVARSCSISAVYLRRITKELYEKAPFQILTELRMKKACEMLLEKRQIQEIASSVGYSDIYQFSRAYKRHFGIPPTVAK